MSDLQQLKATLESIAHTSRQTSGNLAQFKSKLSTQMNQVSAAIGGSTQRKDREVLESLAAANKQIEAAVHALEAAAQVTANYGRSL